MSASREKKTRQDPEFISQQEAKEAKAAEQKKAEKRSSTLYIAIGVLFLIVAIVSLAWRAGLFEKKVAAATVNGVEYSPAEVSYYFQNTYQNFVSQNYYYLSYFGLDISQDLRSQEYAEGETWFDYFAEQALEQLADVQALNDKAKEEGFTWTDEMQANLDTSIEDATSYGASMGYTFEQYLIAVYGEGMTEDVYRAQLKNAMLAQAYCQAYEDTLTYTSAELESAYEANKLSYDVVDYESLRISGSVPTTDKDGNTVEVTDEMKANAMAEAKATAEDLYASFQGGASMESLESDDVDYTDGEGASNYSSALMDWLFDDSRKAGDSAIIEDETYSAYYVVSFEKRYRQDYNTVNVRHILIQPAAGELAEGDEGYEAEQDTLMAEAKDQAEDILAQWKAGEATEDSFAQLAMEYSSDSNASEGGIYTQVTQGYMVESFNDWIFDSSRKVGDTDIVETEFGYHVMYFVGEDLPYWELQATSALMDEEFSAWYEEKTEGYTAEAIEEGMAKVG